MMKTKGWWMRTRWIKGLLIVGVVAGFGSEIHRHRGSCQADALARVCVDAALGRAPAPEHAWGGHRARWVAERCAAHARAGEAAAP